MKKILVSGSFDLIHPGHIYFLKTAKKYGDYLAVIVARDSTIKKVKGKKPKFNENERLRQIKKFKFVDEAVLGYKRNKISILKKIKPNIICLGYDQNYLIEEMKEFIKKNNLKIRMIRLKSFKPHIYKSSKLKSIQKL